MFIERNKQKIPCLCSHAFPIKLMLIEHRVVVMTNNASNMVVTAKKLQIIMATVGSEAKNPKLPKPHRVVYKSSFKGEQKTEFFHASVPAK